MKVLDSIASAITPVIKETGNYLEEITLVGDTSKLLTIVVDSDSHLTLDQVTSITKEISTILENLPELGDAPFTLEVTSPGIDRPLTLHRHWKKNAGKLVKATLNTGSVITGRIGESTDSAVIIGESLTPFVDIKSAFIEIEFKPLNKGAASER